MFRRAFYLLALLQAALFSYASYAKDKILIINSYHSDLVWVCLLIRSPLRMLGHFWQ